MIIIGAKGHAKELLELINVAENNLFFFDNVSKDLQTHFLGKFKILTKYEEVNAIFKNDNTFALGIGNPVQRNNLAKLFTDLGGQLISIISEKAIIAINNVKLDRGLNIMPGVIIYGDTSIGEGSLLNTACSIHHDASIGKYCEIAPGARILGKAIINNFCSIGSNAVILPEISVGNGAIVGAGAVVTKNIPQGEIWAGVPAKKIK